MTRTCNVYFLNKSMLVKSPRITLSFLTLESLNGNKNNKVIQKLSIFICPYFKFFDLYPYMNLKRIGITFT